jgi:hypothetical protein
MEWAFFLPFVPASQQRQQREKLTPANARTYVYRVNTHGGARLPPAAMAAAARSGVSGSGGGGDGGSDDGGACRPGVDARRKEQARQEYWVYEALPAPVARGVPIKQGAGAGGGVGGVGLWLDQPLCLRGSGR